MCRVPYSEVHKMLINGSLKRDGSPAIVCAILCAIFVLFSCTQAYASSENAGTLTTESAVTETDSGRELAVDFIGGSTGYSVSVYDNANGLPTSEANAIAQTEDGFIWIGSYSGLVRYDGTNFERIDSKNGIANVVSLYVDKKERLWIGTNDSGVFCTEKGSLRKYDKASGLESLSIRSIAEDDEGNIYLATTEGIAIVDARNDELRIFVDERLYGEYIRSLCKGSGNTIYGITMNGDIFGLRSGRMYTYVSREDFAYGYVHAIFPDPERQDCIFLGTTESKVYRCLVRNGLRVIEETDVSPLHYINSLGFIDGLLWVCTDNGICFADKNRVRIFDEGPLSVAAENMMADYQGNLWFTSSQQGVMKIVANRFSDLFDQNYMNDAVVNATCKYGDDLYIGTKNNGIIVLSKDKYRVDEIPLSYSVHSNGEPGEYKDLIKMLEKARIRDIETDSKGRLWICSFGETPLVCYDGEKAMIYSTMDGMPSDRARAFCERSDGSYAVAFTGGLVIIKDDIPTAVYTEKEGILNTEILTVTEGYSGELIIGTDGGGLFIIEDGKVTGIDTDSGLPSDIVLRVKKDNDGAVLWIITGNSIAYMTGDRKIVTVREFPYSNNFDIYENKYGEMWVLSSNGIYVVPKSELLANGMIDPMFYGIQNGLPCITTANSFSALTDDGHLYISGRTGVAKVNINDRNNAVGAIKMSVPYVDADGVMIYPDKDGRFVLNPDVKKLVIYSYVYNYSLSDPTVTYWLDGFEETKITVDRSELGPVTYTNLKGNDYTFVMELHDRNSSEQKTMKVTIVKNLAVHEQLWFRIMCLVLGIGLIVGIVAIYIKRKMNAYRKKEQENKILVREIVEAFAKVVDMKDKYTNGHSARVAEYTALMAEELGYDEETIDKFTNIALLHDIGKVGIPVEVLNKPGKLTDEEYAIIKSHSALGYETLKGISIMPDLAIGAGSHHERPDGKGYPNGLTQDEIPRVSQIIAVVDTFDAMYSNRPYRKRMNFERAVSIIKEASGTQLTPDAVDAFMRLVEKGKICRAEDDEGFGTTENIDNIHKQFSEQEKKEKKENVQNV